MSNSNSPQSAILKNPAREAIVHDGLALGVAIRLVHKVDIGKIMRTCGFDFLFLDMEHTPVSSEVISQICVASQDAGIAPIVRVPGLHDRTTVVHVLDGGAQGIIFPHVDDADEARLAVSMCRYPPVGRRSVAYGLPHANYRSVPTATLVAEMEHNVWSCCHARIPRSIDEAEAIAAVDGVRYLARRDARSEHGVRSAG